MNRHLVPQSLRVRPHLYRYLRRTGLRALKDSRGSARKQYQFIRDSLFQGGRAERPLDDHLISHSAVLKDKEHWLKVTQRYVPQGDVLEDFVSQLFKSSYGRGNLSVPQRIHIDHLSALFSDSSLFDAFLEAFNFNLTNGSFYLVGEYDPCSGMIDQLQVCYSTSALPPLKKFSFHLKLEKSVDQTSRLIDFSGFGSPVLALAIVEGHLEETLADPIERHLILNTFRFKKTYSHEQIQLDDLLAKLKLGPVYWKRLHNSIAKAFRGQLVSPRLIVELDPHDEGRIHVAATEKTQTLKKNQFEISWDKDLHTIQFHQIGNLDEATQLKIKEFEKSLTQASEKDFSDLNRVSIQDITDELKKDPKTALSTLQQIRLNSTEGRNRHKPIKSLWTTGQPFRLRMGLLNGHTHTKALRLILDSDVEYDASSHQTVHFDYHGTELFVKAARGKHPSFDFAVAYFLGAHPQFKGQIDAVSASLLARVWDTGIRPSLSEYPSTCDANQFNQFFEVPQAFNQLLDLRKKARPDQASLFDEEELVFTFRLIKHTGMVSEINIYPKSVADTMEFPTTTAVINMRKVNDDYVIDQIDGSYSFEFALHYNKTQFGMDYENPLTKKLLAKHLGLDKLHHAGDYANAKAVEEHFAHFEGDPTLHLWNQLNAAQDPSTPRPETLWLYGSVSSNKLNPNEYTNYGLTLSTTPDPRDYEISRLRVEFTWDNENLCYFPSATSASHKFNTDIINAAKNRWSFIKSLRIELKENNPAAFEAFDRFIRDGRPVTYKTQRLIETWSQKSYVERMQWMKIFDKLATVYQASFPKLITADLLQWIQNKRLEMGNYKSWYDKGKQWKHSPLTYDLDSLFVYKNGRLEVDSRAIAFLEGYNEAHPGQLVMVTAYSQAETARIIMEIPELAITIYNLKLNRRLVENFVSGYKKIVRTGEITNLLNNILGSSVNTRYSSPALGSLAKINPQQSKSTALFLSSLFTNKHVNTIMIPIKNGGFLIAPSVPDTYEEPQKRLIRDSDITRPGLPPILQSRFSKKPESKGVSTSKVTSVIRKVSINRSRTRPHTSSPKPDQPSKMPEFVVFRRGSK